MSPWFLAWLSAFAVTQVVECPIYVRALIEEREPPTRWPLALALAFAASAITHPVVWFVFPRLIPGPYLVMVAAAELFAIGVEAAWLRGFGLRRALLWAVFANAASVVVGVALRQLVGWP